MSDKPDPLWFKAKRYGYGWYPATWQGWAALLAYLDLFFGGLLLLLLLAESETEAAIFFIPIGLVLTLLILYVAYRTGEPARWRWGGKFKK